MQDLREELQLLDALNTNRLYKQRFSAHLDSKYQRFYTALIYSQMKSIFFIGVFLFACFAVLDYVVWPDFFSKLLVIRLLSLIPMILLYLCARIFSSLKARVHILMFIGILISGLTILVMTMQLPAPINELYYFGLLPVCAFAIGVIRLPFIYGCITIWGLFASYLLLETFYPFATLSYSADYYYNDSLLIFFTVLWIAANVVLMFSSYLTEVNYRRSFITQRILASEKKELSYLSQKLHQQSITDPLTGLFNRRYLNEKLEQHWRLGLQDHQRIAIFMVDIDEFKKYNDEYGHLEGDQCLIQVAQALDNCLADKEKVVARFGGEEFVVLLRAEQEELAQIAETLSNSVSELKLPHSSHSVFEMITVSIGVIAMIPQPNFEPSKLLDQADQQLYLAKNAGRDCYKVA